MDLRHSVPYTHHIMIGEKLLHYEIVQKIGAGGMGEVYRARDSKLGREVAIKILPTELSSDPERIARFDREARTLASLQHPNVATIYGFEEVDATRFLVMELVSGGDLGSRMAQSKFSLDETMSVARQIATGLEAAHERGIIHRDLKPANIMLNDSGEAKILDFGLARAWFGDANDDTAQSMSPTITAAMTQAGTILGTAAYMSPEQARGRSVDRRADIWAFGAILWEMVTGQRLFEGETVSDTLAAVLRAEPDWELLPVDEAPQLCRLIERCLVRDPQQRLRDIGEARILLQDGGDDSSLLSALSLSGASLEHIAAPAGARWPLMAAIGLAMLAVGTIVGWKLIGKAPEPQLFHTVINAPPGMRFDMEGRSPGPARLSPNGKMVAFSAMDEDNVSHLYLRHLDQGEAVKLSGTEDAAYPFWSPDSEYIGFFSVMSDKLRKIAVGGGPPVTLCAAENGKGASWNKDGVIIFAPSASSNLYRVPSIGGEPEPVTTLRDGENSHRHPRFLPNGQDFLFTTRSIDGDSFSILMGSLDGHELVEIAETKCQAEFADGYLFTSREGVLFATPFDPATGKLTGGSMPLVEELLIAGLNSAAGSYSVLPSGMMVFQTGSEEEARVISWMDLETQDTQPIGLPGGMHFPRLSPDGRHCFVEVFGESQEGGDLWLVDLDSGQRTRFTFEEGDEVSPCWTPDGSTVVYTSRLNGVNRIMERPLEGTAAPAILLEANERLMTTSIHPDGGGVLFHREFSDTIGTNLEFLAFDGDGTPTVVLAREGYGGRFSPDGRWIAYGWRSAADWDVFVMPAEGGARKWQVTTTGTGWPQWQPDGRRLFVVGIDGTVMAHDVATAGSTFQFGAPEVFMKVETPGNSGIPMTLHPDGKRIVIAGRDPSRPRADFSAIHLVTDWRRALAR